MTSSRGSWARAASSAVAWAGLAVWLARPHLSRWGAAVTCPLLAAAVTLHELAGLGWLALWQLMAPVLLAAAGAARPARRRRPPPEDLAGSRPGHGFTV